MMSATILLVEDNADNQAIYRTILEHSGFTVVSAWDGEEAVRVARETLPALILMDISIPLMDGLSATRILKADPATAGIPIVALTAHAMQEDRAKALDAGCDGYLAKPVEPRRVMEEARRWTTAVVDVQPS
jgi:CheY-like chemotaxis protein